MPAGKSGADARDIFRFDFTQFKTRQLEHAASHLFELFKHLK